MAIAFIDSLQNSSQQVNVATLSTPFGWGSVAGNLLFGWAGIPSNASWARLGCSAPAGMVEGLDSLGQGGTRVYNWYKTSAGPSDDTYTTDFLGAASKESHTLLEFSGVGTVDPAAAYLGQTGGTSGSVNATPSEDDAYALVLLNFAQGYKFNGNRFTPDPAFTLLADAYTGYPDTGSLFHKVYGLQLGAAAPVSFSWSTTGPGGDLNTTAMAFLYPAVPTVEPRRRPMVVF